MFFIVVEKKTRGNDISQAKSVSLFPIHEIGVVAVSIKLMTNIREQILLFLSPRAKSASIHHWLDNFKSILILNDTYMVLPTATETAPVRQRQYYINAEERNIKVSFYPQTINTHPPIYIIN